MKTRKGGPYSSSYVLSQKLTPAGALPIFKTLVISVVALHICFCPVLFGLFRSQITMCFKRLESPTSVPCVAHTTFQEVLVLDRNASNIYKRGCPRPSSVHTLLTTLCMPFVVFCTTYTFSGVEILNMRRIISDRIRNFLAYFTCLFFFLKKLYECQP